MLGYARDDLEKLFSERFTEIEKTAPVMIGIDVRPSAPWHSDAPKGAGVYLIYREARLVYCGETHNLKRRLKDLGRTVNHTWRRSLGNLILRDFDKFKVATSSKKFHNSLETILNSHVQSYGVRFSEISLGRKEFESWVIRTQNPVFNRENSKCDSALAFFSALQAEVNMSHGAH